MLYFAGRGVTHVIVADVELLAFQIGGANNGAAGVGWAPTLDVNDAHDPGDTGAGVRECKARMAAAGQTFGGKRLAAALVYSLCDAMLLTAGGANAGGGLTGAAIRQGILRLAPRFSSAIGFATGLGPTKYFVPGAVRGKTWNGGCDCFEYTAARAAL